MIGDLVLKIMDTWPAHKDAVSLTTEQNLPVRPVISIISIEISYDIFNPKRLHAKNLYTS